MWAIKKKTFLQDIILKMSNPDQPTGKYFFIGDGLKSHDMAFLLNVRKFYKNCVFHMSL